MFGSAPAETMAAYQSKWKLTETIIVRFNSCLLGFYCCRRSSITLFEAAYVGTEEWHVSRSQFVAKIDVAMGGRAAEEIVFGKDKVETFVEQEEFF